MWWKWKTGKKYDVVDYWNNRDNPNSKNPNERNTQKHIDYVKSNIDGNDTSETIPQPTVKRLSLFDTIEKPSEISKNPPQEKTEPVISENLQDTDNNTDSEPEEEFDPEEKDLNDEFNQETEEELLDIPTFLRRQAN